MLQADTGVHSLPKSFLDVAEMVHSFDGVNVGKLEGTMKLWEIHRFTVKGLVMLKIRKGRSNQNAYFLDS